VGDPLLDQEIAMIDIALLQMLPEEMCSLRACDCATGELMSNPFPNPSSGCCLDEFTSI
jgi:hypothetical protein